MLICCAFRRRRRWRCSFVSCFQWIVNKQRLLSLQRRDSWLVSVLVSAAVSAIPIPTATTGIGPIPIPSTGIGLSLVTNGVVYPSANGHPSINWGRHRVTMLIETIARPPPTFNVVNVMCNAQSDWHTIRVSLHRHPSIPDNTKIC